MSIISIFCAILVKKEKRYIIQNSTLPVHRSIDGFKWTKNEPGSGTEGSKHISVNFNDQ